MGDTLWVDVRGRPEGDLPRDNSIMLHLGPQLDRLAGQLNVLKLSEFYDSSALEEAYCDLGNGEDDEPDVPTDGEAATSGERWHDPGPALAAVRAIRAHLTKHPADLGFQPDPPRAHWPGSLMDELAECESVLETAAAQGRQFRLLIVP